jgi:hypothetical protein
MRLLNQRGIVFAIGTSSGVFVRATWHNCGQLLSAAEGRSTLSCGAAPRLIAISTMAGCFRRHSCLLFGLTGSIWGNALSELSGEAATGAQKVGFHLTDQFLNLMLDPFVDGRSGIGAANSPPSAQAWPPDIALAYASVLKGPRVPTPIYEPR